MALATAETVSSAPSMTAPTSIMAEEEEALHLAQGEMGVVELEQAGPGAQVQPTQAAAGQAATQVVEEMAVVALSSFAILSCQLPPLGQT